MNPHGWKLSSSARLKHHAKMAGKPASGKAKSHRVFGQARKPAKTARAGLYVRVYTHDQRTLHLQIRVREYAARRRDVDVVLV